jgi:hypothetical protein
MSAHDKGPGHHPGATRLSAVGKSEVDAFLAEASRIAPAAEARGRMVFALDATMSRQPTWDLACSLQSEMFDAAGAIGRALRPARLFPRHRRMPGFSFVRMRPRFATSW